MSHSFLAHPLVRDNYKPETTNYKLGIGLCFLAALRETAVPPRPRENPAVLLPSFPLCETTAVLFRSFPLCETIAVHCPRSAKRLFPPYLRPAFSNLNPFQHVSKSCHQWFW
jgi:hypothetical protein